MKAIGVIFRSDIQGISPPCTPMDEDVKAKAGKAGKEAAEGSCGYDGGEGA